MEAASLCTYHQKILLIRRMSTQSCWCGPTANAFIFLNSSTFHKIKETRTRTLMETNNNWDTSTPIARKPSNSQPTWGRCMFIHIIQHLMYHSQWFISGFFGWTHQFAQQFTGKTSEFLFHSTSFHVTHQYFDRQGNLNDKHFSPAKLILICIWQTWPCYRREAAGPEPGYSAHYFPLKLNGV